MATAALYTFQANPSGRAGIFHKDAEERFPIAIDMRRVVASDTTLHSALLTAIDLDDTTPVSTVVTPSGHIIGQLVEFTVQQGTTGRGYQITATVRDTTHGVYRQHVIMRVR